MAKTKAIYEFRHWEELCEEFKEDPYDSGFREIDIDQGGGEVFTYEFVGTHEEKPEWME